MTECDVLKDLDQTIRERQRMADPRSSYTAELLSDDRLLRRKVIEEAFEFCLELEGETHDQRRVAEEGADLLYHVLVGLVRAGIGISAVCDVLETRRGG